MLSYERRRSANNFLGEGMFREIRALRETFPQKVKKEQGNILEFFRLDISKLHFEWQI